MTHKATLVFPILHDKVLLSYVHKPDKVISKCLNGYGGKLKDEHENPLDRAVTELFEEVGLHAHKEDLRPVAMISFYFSENSQEPLFKVLIYILYAWHGLPQESEEMSNPTYYQIDNMPLKAMMPADQIWIPLILAGETFEGKVVFSEDGKEVISFTKNNVHPSSLSF